MGDDLEKRVKPDTPTRLDGVKNYFSILADEALEKGDYLGALDNYV